jgi:hypothetical protein
MRLFLVCVGAALAAMAVVIPLSAAGNNGQVCASMDGKFESSGSGTGFSVSINGTEATISVEAGYTLVAYCVKAGSVNQGNGPVTSAVDLPGPGSIIVGHPSGKDISHVSVDVEPTGTPTETTPTETTPTETTPTETTPTETTPTETTPTETTPTETTPTETTPTETTPTETTPTETTPTETTPPEPTPTETTPPPPAHGGNSGVSGSGAGGGATKVSSPVAQPKGELPYTGLPVWSPLLAAGGLLTAGLGLLRGSRRWPRG